MIYQSSKNINYLYHSDNGDQGYIHVVFLDAFFYFIFLRKCSNFLLIIEKQLEYFIQQSIFIFEIYVTNEDKFKSFSFVFFHTQKLKKISYSDEFYFIKSVPNSQ